MPPTTQPKLRSALLLLAALCAACDGDVHPASDPGRPIGILAAIPEEARLLRQQLQDPESFDSGGRTFHRGTIGSHRVVLTLSGVGKVNAALSAQRLISEHHVRAILFLGVAGRVRYDGLEVGDLVVARQTFQHDFGYQRDNDLTTHPPGNFPGDLSDPRQGNLAYDLDQFWPRPGTVQRAVARGQSLEPRLAEVEVGGARRRPKVVAGVIATGDQFIASELRRQQILALGGDAVEMEGAAVAQVTSTSQTPLLLVRAVSDSAGGGAHVDFASFLPRVAGNNALLIEALLEANDLP